MILLITCAWILYYYIGKVYEIFFHSFSSKSRFERHCTYQLVRDSNCRQGYTTAIASLVYMYLQLTTSSFPTLIIQSVNVCVEKTTGQSTFLCALNVAWQNVGRHKRPLIVYVLHTTPNSTLQIEQSVNIVTCSNIMQVKASFQ